MDWRTWSQSFWRSTNSAVEMVFKNTVKPFSSWTERKRSGHVTWIVVDEGKRRRHRHFDITLLFILSWDLLIFVFGFLYGWVSEWILEVKKKSERRYLEVLSSCVIYKSIKDSFTYSLTRFYVCPKTRRCCLFVPPSFRCPVHTTSYDRAWVE